MKVSGAYESVVRGVSEQAPQDRRSGQHHEQVNMVSDPVRGLARRHGSVSRAEKVLGPYLPLDYDKLVEDSRTHRTHSFRMDDDRYDLIYRSQPGPLATRANMLHLYDQRAHSFVPIVTTYFDDTIDRVSENGIAAIAVVGKFIYLAGNGIAPTATITPKYDTAPNRRYMAAWVRGGAYSRTFTVSATKADGTVLSGVYKTKSSSYPTLLDTTGIPAAAPDYQKQINDTVNAYNSRATAWIGQAAEDITPENIAEKLATELRLHPELAAAVSVMDSTILIDSDDFVELTCDDSGDGSLIRAVGNEVRAAELVAPVHWAGKVVRVRPSNGKSDEAFYLKAIPEDGKAFYGWTRVRWIETAGEETALTSVFLMGTFHAGTLYIASNAADLATLTGLDVPDFALSGVGDGLTSPLPQFIDKPITHMTVFQDRLIIVAGSAVSASRSGDFLNFFRHSAITILDTDPVEVLSLGNEADDVRYSTTFDTNLILWGDNRQYVISGKQVLTPRTAASSFATLSAHEESVDAPPKSSGNLVFYSKRSGSGGSYHASLQQVQAGVLADSPDNDSASSQLDKYVRGKAVEIVPFTSPNVVVVRTDQVRDGLYVYGYLDDARSGARLFDSWSRWQWAPELGNVIGVSRGPDNALLVYMLRRWAAGGFAEEIALCCEEFRFDTPLSDLPYLDSLRPHAAFVAGTGTISMNTQPDRLAFAFGKDHPNAFIGAGYSRIADLADYPIEETYAGFQYPASVTPTNPFTRDRNGVPITLGRTTLSRVVASVADSGGLRITVNSDQGGYTSLNWYGRKLGEAVIGRQPIVTTTIGARVGREIRECTYTMSAQNWLPLTITAIEWVGQYFNNTRRV